jgi:hypothetical protein
MAVFLAFRKYFNSYIEFYYSVLAAEAKIAPALLGDAPRLMLAARFLAPKAPPQ